MSGDTETVRPKGGEKKESTRGYITPTPLAPEPWCVWTKDTNIEVEVLINRRTGTRSKKREIRGRSKVRHGAEGEGRDSVKRNTEFQRRTRRDVPSARMTSHEGHGSDQKDVRRRTLFSVSLRLPGRLVHVGRTTLLMTYLFRFSWVWVHVTGFPPLL